MEQEKRNALVTRARAGDPEAMNELINISYQDIYFYALKVVKNEDIAADATQDSCIEIIQTIGNLKESAAFVTWCRRIVYHQCTKRIGKTRIVALEENEDGETILDRIPDETPGALPEEVVEDREFRKLMMDMIDQLPEGQRSALLLYYYERLSVKQIAEIQDEKENTIKSRLYQGRNAVKKQVEDYQAKTGTKLYSVGIIPLLMYLFRASKAEAEIAAAAAAPGIQAAVAPVIAAASGAAGAGATAATAAAGAGVLGSLGAKIVAGVLAVTLVAGAAAVVPQLLEESDKPRKSSSSSEGKVTLPPPALQEHIHSYDIWNSDEQTHWLSCLCGEFTVAENHMFEGGQCTVCHAPDPQPAGSSAANIDITTLAGRWLNITNDYRDDPVQEFAVNEDGTFTIMGTTYYSIGSDIIGVDGDGNEMIGLFLQQTPVDPTVNVTPEEMYKAYVTVKLEKIGEHYAMSLTMEDPKTHNLAFHNVFYRESDYAGYEKVALTPENFSQYIDVTFRPIEFYYTAHNLGLMATGYMDLTLREGLGYPSWCKAEGKLEFRYNDVGYNVETMTYEILDPESPLTYKSLSVDFFGNKEAVRVINTDGSGFMPENGVVSWRGEVPEAYVPTSVTGYVFVPVE